MFPGFYRPRANFYKLPNDWFDIWMGARQHSGQAQVGTLQSSRQVKVNQVWPRSKGKARE